MNAVQQNAVSQAFDELQELNRGLQANIIECQQGLTKIRQSRVPMPGMAALMGHILIGEILHQERVACALSLLEDGESDAVERAMAVLKASDTPLPAAVVPGATIN